MIPDYLIYDELQRRREKEREWEPEPLRLPLYAPELPSKNDKKDEDEDSAPSRGVIIIDMSSD